jgi:hypothetical protein
MRMVLKKCDVGKRGMDPRVAASNRFKRYKEESEKKTRKAEAKTDKILQRMISAWESFLNAFPYKKVWGIRSLEYTAGDVERFCLMLGEYEDEPDLTHASGDFLTALIRHGGGSSYRLPLGHIQQEIASITLENEKNLLIDGGNLWFLGDNMSEGRIHVRQAKIRDMGGLLAGGSIIIEGDAEESIGFGMQGGTIIIEGNVIANRNGVRVDFDELRADHAGVGFGMSDGTIIIKGDAGEHIGHEMEGGGIYLEGGYVSISDKIFGGKIYHKGKLIVDK